MAWNDPGKNGKNENPWQRRPEKGPPDLDEVLRRFQKKLRSLSRLQPDVRRRRLYGFLARRGYPPDFVREVVNRLTKE